MGFIVSEPVTAQKTSDRESTERRLRELQMQIERDEQRLARTREEEQSTLDRLQNVEREIAIRRELNLTYQKRLVELSIEADSIRRSMIGLETQVAGLKQEYQKRAIHAYKYGRLHDLALILSASSINQMLIRARYLNRFADQRRSKYRQLQESSRLLQEKEDTLLATRVRNEQLLNESVEQQRDLVRLQQDRQQLLASLRNERSNLQETVHNKLEAAEDLAVLIRRLPGVKTNPRSVRAPGSATTPGPGTNTSFGGARGRLGWPSSGVVKERFGESISPIYGTATTNPGIFIASNPAEPVYSVADGEVVLVDVMPEYGTIIAVAHGEYKTVFGNLSRVLVKAGDRVRVGQEIARGGTTDEPQGDGVFFAIFKQGEPIDPEPWLRPR